MASRAFPLPPVARAWRAAPATSRSFFRSARLPHPRLVGAFALLVVLASAGWWWGRDSSLVAVREVRISGLASNQTAAIRSALTGAAQDMTTLHVDEARLRRAVAAFPVVAAVRATGAFPHLLKITVVERRPVAMLKAAGQTIAVAGDGTLLRGLVDAKAPSVILAAPPAGPVLKDPLALAQVRILATAPAPLRARVERMFTGARGMQAQLRDGPVVAFGAADRLEAKWSALVAVLGDPASAGASLVDLTVPESPAATGLEPLTSKLTAGTGLAPTGATAATGPQPAPQATTAAPAP